MIELSGKRSHPKTLLSHQYHCSWSLFFWYNGNAPDRWSLFPTCNSSCNKGRSNCHVFFTVARAKSLKNHDRAAFQQRSRLSNLRRSHLPAYLNPHSLQGVEVLLVSVDHQSTWSISFSWELTKVIWLSLPPSLTCKYFWHWHESRRFLSHIAFGILWMGI